MRIWKDSEIQSDVDFKLKGKLDKILGMAKLKDEYLINSFMG